MNNVRVRFAPSPTGPLHLGGVRTALYDYLFAKKQKGTFVLRIEDTDSQRFVEGAEEYIMEALEWCGITPDESPKHGGPYGPYRQSERRAIYDRYTEQILKTDFAYLAFDTPEELEEIRKEYEEKGEVFAYNYFTRTRLRNSLSLSKEETSDLLLQKTPYVVRFKMPVDRILQLEDLIRGKFSVNTNTLDDKVLVKNDGMPTYHFANIIDDHLMEISHVIRGEEWLPSMGLHVLLYEALDWDPPKFAHLSLILKPEGKGKLSKRDGDKFGFPVFPLEFKDPTSGTVSMGYREQGYYPEAFINFLALLGWTPADNKEILSLSEMIEEFDIEKLHKAGARFSKEKAEWFNQQYLHLRSDKDVLEDIRPMITQGNTPLTEEKLLKIVSLMKDRCIYAKDIVTEGKFFFKAPSYYDEKAVQKAWSDSSTSILENLSLKLESTAMNAAEIKDTIKLAATNEGVGIGKVMMPLRLALVGELTGPDVPDIIEVLGKEESISRIRNAVNNIPTLSA